MDLYYFTEELIEKNYENTETFRNKLAQTYDLFERLEPLVNQDFMNHFIDLRAMIIEGAYAVILSGMVDLLKNKTLSKLGNYLFNNEYQSLSDDDLLGLSQIGLYNPSPLLSVDLSSFIEKLIFIQDKKTKPDYELIKNLVKIKNELDLVSLEELMNLEIARTDKELLRKEASIDQANIKYSLKPKSRIIRLTEQHLSDLNELLVTNQTNDYEIDYFSSCEHINEESIKFLRELILSYKSCLIRIAEHFEEKLKINLGELVGRLS